MFLMEYFRLYPQAFEGFFFFACAIYIFDVLVLRKVPTFVYNQTHTDQREFKKNQPGVLHLRTVKYWIGAALVLSVFETLFGVYELSDNLFEDLLLFPAEVVGSFLGFIVGFGISVIGSFLHRHFNKRAEHADSTLEYLHEVENWLIRRFGRIIHRPKPEIAEEVQIQSVKDESDLVEHNGAMISRKLYNQIMAAEK